MEADPLQSEKKRDPERFEQARGDIDDLIRQAQAGDIELAFVDEAGFAPQPPNRSAWARRGETHVVEAKRSKRLNVIGALLSSGRLLMAKLWHTVNGLWFFGFLMGLIERVQKPLVVILDNASIHTAKSMQPYWELLECEFSAIWKVAHPKFYPVWRFPNNLTGDDDGLAHATDNALS